MLVGRLLLYSELARLWNKSCSFGPRFRTFFQSIAATAEEEVARSATNAAAGVTPGDEERDASGCNTENGEVEGKAGLDADGFVRVCLQLLRDNFLVKVWVATLPVPRVASCLWLFERERYEQRFSWPRLGCEVQISRFHQRVRVTPLVWGWG